MIENSILHFNGRLEATHIWFYFSRLTLSWEEEIWCLSSFFSVLLDFGKSLSHIKHSEALGNCKWSRKPPHRGLRKTRDNQMVHSVQGYFRRLDVWWGAGTWWLNSSCLSPPIPNSWLAAFILHGPKLCGHDSSWWIRVGIAAIVQMQDFPLHWGIIHADAWFLYTYGHLVGLGAILHFCLFSDNFDSRRTAVYFRRAFWYIILANVRLCLLNNKHWQWKYDQEANLLRCDSPIVEVRPQDVSDAASLQSLLLEITAKFAF